MKSECNRLRPISFVVFFLTCCAYLHTTTNTQRRYDPSERPTAEEALEHDYFEPIRRLLLQEAEEERRRRHYPFLPAAVGVKEGGGAKVGRG